MGNTLGIGDPHEPVSHPGYLPLCQDLQQEYGCDEVVILGDIADHQAISFHAANPMCPGPNDEAALTYEKIQKWYKAFPKAKVCIGNHDARVLRLAESVKIPSRYIRDYNGTWETPGWEWEYEYFIDNVCYTHGTGSSGVHPAWNLMTKKMKSVVIGHCHSRAGVKWMSTGDERFFACDTGCGIDVRAWQFAYGRNFPTRPFLAAAVIKDNGTRPESVPMLCGPGEKYHRSRF